MSVLLVEAGSVVEIHWRDILSNGPEPDPPADPVADDTPCGLCGAVPLNDRVLFVDDRDPQDRTQYCLCGACAIDEMLTLLDQGQMYRIADLLSQRAAQTN